MKAARILAANIATLLRERHHSQHDLAQWCYHSDPWLSAVLLGKRAVSVKDLDRIADFFGVATYQLFQPGISSYERRSGADRRKGRDRRLSRAQQAMLAVSSDIDQLRHRPPGRPKKKDP